MDNKEDREWVLENVESINADVKDIDELCCALEHSTIFAIDFIQTFATRLIDLDYKYKNQQQELERYKNIIDDLEKWLEKQYQDTENCFMFDKDLKSKYKRDLLLFSMCLDKLKELKGE